MEFIRATTNVCKKILVNAPALTNGDAARAVIFVCAMFGIVASAEHRGPCSVFRRLFPIHSFAMTATRFSAFDTLFSSQAAARIRMPVQELTACDAFFRTAITNTLPSEYSFLVSNSLSDQEPAKSLSFEIPGDCHSVSLNPTGTTCQQIGV
jgi:hypothetical protein